MGSIFALVAAIVIIAIWLYREPSTTGTVISDASPITNAASNKTSITASPSTTSPQSPASASYIGYWKSNNLQHTLMENQETDEGYLLIRNNDIGLMIIESTATVPYTGKYTVSAEDSKSVTLTGTFEHVDASFNFTIVYTKQLSEDEINNLSQDYVDKRKATNEATIATLKTQLDDFPTSKQKTTDELSNAHAKAHEAYQIIVGDKDESKLHTIASGVRKGITWYSQNKTDSDTAVNNLNKALLDSQMEGIQPIQGVSIYRRIIVDSDRLKVFLSKFRSYTPGLNFDIKYGQNNDTDRIFVMDKEQLMTNADYANYKELIEQRPISTSSYAIYAKALMQDDYLGFAGFKGDPAGKVAATEDLLEGSTMAYFWRVDDPRLLSLLQRDDVKQALNKYDTYYANITLLNWQFLALMSNVIDYMTSNHLEINDVSDFTLLHILLSGGDLVKAFADLSALENHQNLYFSVSDNVGGIHLPAIPDVTIGSSNLSYHIDETKVTSLNDVFEYDTNVTKLEQELNSLPSDWKGQIQQLTDDDNNLSKAKAEYVDQLKKNCDTIQFNGGDIRLQGLQATIGSGSFVRTNASDIPKGDERSSPSGDTSSTLPTMESVVGLYSGTNRAGFDGTIEFGDSGKFLIKDPSLPDGQTFGDWALHGNFIDCYIDGQKSFSIKVQDDGKLLMGGNVWDKVR